MTDDTQDDGGPAFPSDLVIGNAVTGRKPYDGMSLRDYFAAQAIRARWGNGVAMTPEEAAMMAYQLADAMIAERSHD